MAVGSLELLEEEEQVCRQYEGAVSDELYCPICYDNVVSCRVSCGHAFCVVCIRTHLTLAQRDGQRALCPICRAVPGEEAQGDVGLYRLAAEPAARAHCLGREHGCTFSALLPALRAHERTCALTPAACAHARLGCRARPPRGRKRVHEKTCRFNPTARPCAHERRGCAVSATPALLRAHRKTCAFQATHPCRWRHLGCQVSTPRAGVRAHARSCCFKLMQEVRAQQALPPMLTRGRERTSLEDRAPERGKPFLPSACLSTLSQSTVADDERGGCGSPTSASQRHSGVSQMGTSQMSTSQMSTSQMSTSTMHVSQMGTSQVVPSQMSAPHLNASQMSVTHLGAPQMSVTHLGAPQMRAPHLSAPHLGDPHLDDSSLEPTLTTHRMGESTKKKPETTVSAVCSVACRVKRRRHGPRACTCRADNAPLAHARLALVARARARRAAKMKRQLAPVPHGTLFDVVLQFRIDREATTQSHVLAKAAEAPRAPSMTDVYNSMFGDEGAPREDTPEHALLTRAGLIDLKRRLNRVLPAVKSVANVRAARQVHVTLARVPRAFLAGVAGLLDQGSSIQKDLKLHFVGIQLQQ